MTEQEWLTGADPAKMLSLVDTVWPHMTKEAKQRKLRLFACACCRQVWHLLTDERSRKAVEVAELFVDGEATEEELGTANDGSKVVAMKEWQAYWCSGQSATEAALRMASRDGEHWQSDTDDQYPPPAVQADLLREIMGNPWRLVLCPHSVGIDPICLRCREAWLSQQVMTLANEAYMERLPDGTLDIGCLAALSDALEEAGCTDEAILNHLRGEVCPHCKDAAFGVNDHGNEHFAGKEPYASRAKAYWASKCPCKGTRRLPSGPHVRGCWVVDLLLSKT